MNMNKRILKIVALTLGVMVPAQAFAMCTWGFVPPTRIYEPLNATEAFVYFDGEMQTVVMVPEFKGDAEDFGIVYPTPAKPIIEEGNADLFVELNDLTNPELPIMMFAADDTAVDMSAVRNESTVEVVEVKEVGDYTATVLKAEKADDLVEWLEDNGYEYSDLDEDKFDYYVDQTGYYFVALKVNIEAAELDSEGFVVGKLGAIEMTFESDRLELPMRSLESDMPEMNFDLYILSDDFYYVPGVDTYFAQKVGATHARQAPSLRDFDYSGKWLVRQNVVFDPSQISEDLYLVSAQDSNDLIIENSMSPKRFDPQLLDTDTGVRDGTAGQIAYTDGTVVVEPVVDPVMVRPPVAGAVVLTRNLTIGSVGNDVLELQRWLNANGFLVSEAGAGAPGQETTYFGNRTRQAVIQMQNAFAADILTPVGLTAGTGFVGPSTREYLEGLSL